MPYNRSKEGEARRVASMPKGKAHWNWSKQPTLLALHKRLHRQYGPAKMFKCSTNDCERQAHDWANMTGRYTDKITDYAPLCRSCHVKRDKNWMKRP